MKNNIFKLVLASYFAYGVALVVAPGTANASDEQRNEDLSISVDNSTLEELLNIKTSVATKKELTARETPGIVSVITAEDIRNMGARDLIDLLRTVPSIHFGNDVQGVVGLGIRGMWAAEGKHLLMIDGIEMNELQFAGTQFGNEFPVDQISRIEIIRGPGSAIYGGFAELAVINIVTKSGGELNGTNASVTYGQWENVSARTNLSVSSGRDMGAKSYSVGGYIGQAKRGDGTYSGTGDAEADGNPYSGTMDFEDADQIRPMLLNMGYKNSGFNIRFLYNKYAVDSHTMFGYTAFGDSKGAEDAFETYNLLTSYAIKPNVETVITPQLQVNWQSPWRQKSGEAIFTYSKNEVNSLRIRPSLTLQKEISDDLNLLVGAEHVVDQHEIIDWQVWDTGSLVPATFGNGTNDEKFSSTSAYAQVLAKMAEFDLAVGARYEKPSETKASFVPRLGLTRAESRWHAKLLYAQAFRSPVLFNYENKVGSEILPESATTSEIEFGFATSSLGYLTANIYSTRIDDPIVYMVSGSEEYDNFNELGTDGLELEHKSKFGWGQVQLGYAYYEVAKSDVVDYEVPGKKKQFLGMPQNTASLNATYFLRGKDLKLNGQVIHMSEKYAYDYDGAAMALVKLDAATLVGIYLERDNLWAKGLAVGVGVHNLLDEEVHYAQPYNGGHSPVPGPSRELMVRLNYARPF